MASQISDDGMDLEENRDVGSILADFNASPASIKVESSSNELSASVGAELWELCSLLTSASNLGQAELRSAAAELSRHGLMFSAKWTAEQVVGLGEIEGDNDAIITESASSKDSLTTQEQDAITLAKCYFDVREYRRVAHSLAGCKSKLAIFLRGYAIYLSGEKRKEEEGMEQNGSKGQNKTVRNNELQALHKELSDLHDNGNLGGFGLHLFGMVLKAMDLMDDARKALQKSVCLYPLNWGAWLDLASICHSQAEVQQLQLPKHWMRLFFSAHMDLELQSNKLAVTKYSALQTIFPHSLYLVSQIALAQYNMRDFNEAQVGFEKILHADPYRLDNMDTYSNILYVKEQKTQLSFVAHNALRNEKFRPETCCIIGNYYSLKSQHEKAVLYFKRALQLNRHYLSAWTLMGHEYVEMRNTAAAIEAYRRALDINPRDYRAWYGLGQTYEILQMHFYSLYYFRKATALRPYDARMWCAMGQCYECLEKYEEAIKCYKRAYENGDREGIALNKLGKLYSEIMDDPREAAKHFELNLRLLDAEQVESQQTMDALLFLARYYKDPAHGRLDDAEVLCQRLHENYGADKEEVSALMKEIRSVQQRVLSASRQGGGMFSGYSSGGPGGFS